MDTELGGFFLMQTDGSPWSAYGAFIGVLSAYSASVFDAHAIKANYTRFNVFKPSDDTTWNYFPYQELRDYEAREVAAGRPPIFITATYQGKKRPVLWAWSLGLVGGPESSEELQKAVPTRPPSDWQYAVNVGDERFIRFWLNRHMRPLTWQGMYDVPNLWWGLDEAAVLRSLYGVLDDNNRFVSGVQWDPPFPQDVNAFTASAARFFSRVKALAPDIKLMPNLATLDNPNQFPTYFSDVAGLVQENYYEKNPSDFSRNAWLPYFDGISWFGEQGRVVVLRAMVSRSDSVLNAYAVYQLLKGPNFFFAPMYDNEGGPVPHSQYSRMEADLGNPAGTYKSDPEPGMGAGYRLFWRMFDGGIVYVNWTGKTKTVVLPGDRPYFDINGRPATQITLADSAGGYVSTTALPKAARPSISPRMSTPAAGPISVTVQSDTPGASIYYTTDGSAPTTSSMRYTGPLRLASSATLKTIAAAPNYANSAVATALYTLTGAVPQVQFTAAADGGPAGTAFPILSLNALPNAPVTVDYLVTQPNGSTTQSSARFLEGEVYRFFPVQVSGPMNSTARVTILRATNATPGPVAQFSYTIGEQNNNGASAAMISPAPGSTLSTTSVTFNWSSGTAVTQYHLFIGTAGIGSSNVFSLNTGTNTSQTVYSLPATGGTLYVRLWSYNGTWQYSDYTYQMANLSGAAMISPAPGSMISGTSVTFNWSAGTGVTAYYLYVGTVVGGYDIHVSSMGQERSKTVTNLPVNGKVVYVRLWSFAGGSWIYHDYTYGTQ